MIKITKFQPFPQKVLSLNSKFNALILPGENKFFDPTAVETVITLRPPVNYKYVFMEHGI